MLLWGGWVGGWGCYNKCVFHINALTLHVESIYLAQLNAPPFHLHLYLHIIQLFCDIQWVFAQCLNG